MAPEISVKNGKLSRRVGISDTNLLLTITIVVFFVMYACAVIFLGSGFQKPQAFFNILNDNAALIILSCGMSIVMITGGIDISVGTLQISVPNGRWCGSQRPLCGPAAGAEIIV